MPVIPAICLNSNCNTPFPSGIALEGAGQINFHDCLAGPCPRCGSSGRILDGLYKIVENKLFGQIQNINDIMLLQRALSVIQRELRRSKNPQKTKKKLERQFPSLKDLWKNIPTDDKILALSIIQAICAIICTAIALGALLGDEDKPTVTEQTFQTFYSQKYLSYQPLPQLENQQASRSEPPKLIEL